MPPAAILELKKGDAGVVPEAAQAESAAGHLAADTVKRRRELAVLLRSIKTLVRQSP
jgi:hypothetical protein